MRVDQNHNAEEDPCEPGPRVLGIHPTPRVWVTPMASTVQAGGTLCFTLCLAERAEEDTPVTVTLVVIQGETIAEANLVFDTRRVLRRVDENPVVVIKQGKRSQEFCVETRRSIGVGALVLVEASPRNEPEATKGRALLRVLPRRGRARVTWVALAAAVLTAVLLGRRSTPPR